MFFFCLTESSVLSLKSLLVWSSHPADIPGGTTARSLDDFVVDSKGDATKKMS